MYSDEKKDLFNLNLVKIGDSDCRFNVWYKLSDRSKIPFGNHVKPEEIEECKNILFVFDFYESDFHKEYELEVMFFMDSREYGCGGCVSRIPEIGFDENLQEKLKELMQKTADKIKSWGLEVNKEKLIEQIQDFENQKREIDCSINTLKEML